MKIRFSFEISFEKDESYEPEPSGSESMIIHQDQPRYIGFVQEE